VGTRFAVMLLVVLPLALAVSYGFHRLVERRFMTAHQARLRQGAPAAAVDVSETRSSLPS
jgi:peptidoglycan/LPS O-acetylase OafA/YrhL